MRKAYGPTGVSFQYPFKTFKADVAARRSFRFELVVNGNCFYPEFDLNAHTESELRAFYVGADNLSLQSDGSALIQIFANG